MARCSSSDLPLCACRSAGGLDSIPVVDDRSTDDVRDDVLQALAGAALLRDRLAESGDGEGTVIALKTVDALSRLLDALSIEWPTGLAAMVQRGKPPAPGFVST
jgi:hypothetical protein